MYNYVKYYNDSVEKALVDDFPCYMHMRYYGARNIMVNSPEMNWKGSTFVEYTVVK